MDTEVENGLWTQQRKTGGTNRENSTDIYALPCVKSLTSEKLLSSTGSSASGDDPRGEMGAGQEGG